MSKENSARGAIVLLRPSAGEDWVGRVSLTRPNPARPGKTIHEVIELKGVTEVELREDGFAVLDAATVPPATVGVYTYFTENSFQGHFS